MYCRQSDEARKRTELNLRCAEQKNVNVVVCG